MSRIQVSMPGLLTTVQDLGRPGWQRYGVTPGGAVDAHAVHKFYRLAFIMKL